MYESTKLIKFPGMIALFLLAYCIISTSLLIAQEKEPDQGLKIILNIYSGIPNPQWWLTQGPEFDTTVRLLKELKVQDKKLFQYSKWNRLGYASFWIFPKNLKDLPYAVHIWRDEACVYTIENKKEKAYQAIGALPIYDMLAAQSIQKEQKTFFRKYLKFKADREKKEKEKDKAKQ